MKILRKALFFLLIIALLSIFSAIGVFAANYTEGYYTYTVINGEATIVDVNSSISGDITIPATLGGYPVTEIGGDAFAFCSNLTGVTIPNGVTCVATWGFRDCSKLAEITIPPSLQYFAAEAFFGCTKLKTVNISDLKAWCESDFRGSAYYGVSSNPLAFGGLLYLNGTIVSGDLIIPDGTKKIGECAFFSYDNFTSITIPQSVESFGHWAFSNCKSLEDIYISDLKQWCEFDFSDGADSPLYYAENLYLNGTLLSGDLVIPEGTKSIGACAFYLCDQIKSVYIPDSVASIGQRAFYGCEGISKIDIGAGVQNIGDSAFMTFSTLEEVNIHDLKTWCENGFSVTKGGLLLNGEPVSGRLEIPNGTQKIQAYAFKNCNISEVIIPESVSHIGSYAFASCYDLSNIEIYGSPQIDRAAFGWVGLGAKISFYGEPQSIYDDSYTIDSDIDIWCYSDNDTVKSYASKHGRQLHYFPCKVVCTYAHVVEDAYLKSEGSCTEKSVYYQSCTVCLNASNTLTFEGDFEHDFAERPMTDFLFNSATCTEAAEFYLSCDCGAIHPIQTFTFGEPLGHSYDDTCDEICNRCSFVREAPHDINTIYDYNYDYHWYTCTKCNERFSYELHSYDDNSDAFCNVCDHERTIFVVTYDANGGENAPFVSYVPLGSEGIVSSNVPTRENFVFTGWATVANGTVEYKAEDSLNLTESITLYAVWKKECQECDGTGQTHTTKTCTSCKSGYVYSSSCYFCHGRGIYSTGDMQCSNCWGSGKLKDPYGSDKYVSCFMCGGDGLVPDYQICDYCRRKCTTCNGSTKITIYFNCENCDALGYFDSFEVHYDANGGLGAPSSQNMGGKLDRLSETIPSRKDFVFVGWNTLTDNNAVYQPGDVYSNGEVTFYAMWAPACHSCAGEGHFTAGNTCGSCNGNGTYSVTVKTCNSCGGNHVVTHVTGYGTISYCSNCGSTSIKTSTQTENCSNCVNGIVSSTYQCEDCEGKGYLQTYPKSLSFTDSKIVLLKIDGIEYSIDGINWQDSNIFTDLLPGTEYSFYQRMKATENAPFGFVSAPLLLKTDKADNESIPSTPIAIEITSESIRVDLIDGCEYSIDGENWQSEPLFVNLDCATNYTVYARFPETDTHYASEAISYIIVRTEKGTVSAPLTPTLVAVGRDRVILQKVEGYEYSIDGIHWQSSNVFLGLESKTNYFVYCRFAATDRYCASDPSEALTVKTLAESEVGPTYQITFQDEYGNILSQSSYELYDEVVIPSTLKESDLIYTYRFLQWDKPVSEFCMGEAVYTATYEKKYIDYEVVFKNDNGDVISNRIYHYGDSIVIPENPTKATDSTYIYTFRGWGDVAVNCTGNATYTATYDSAYIDYTVIFKNEDGTVLSTRTYHYGDTVVSPEAPIKTADNTYTYTFAGWDKAFDKCEGNETYTATYTSAYVNYTVVFKNYNGDVISTKTYHYGDAVVVPSNPKKPSDENYCYVFAGWDKSVTNCYGDAVYTAKFTASDLPIATVNNSSARANETVVVNIQLSGAPNLGSLAISDISYNTSAFELLSVDWKVADAILSNWDAATGKGALALSTAKDVNGTIISLTFKVKDGTADGNYPVSCTVTSQECDFKNVAGEITVYSVAPGDVDGNESIDKDDAIYLLMHSFFPEDYPINQDADYNGDGEVNKDDAIHLLMYTFFPDDYPLAPAPAAVTITTTEDRKRDDEDEE